MSKTCNQCNTEKSLESFSPLIGGKFGRRARCKLCESEAARTRRTNNPQASRDAVEKYRISHPEVISRRDAKYYQKYKERQNNKTKQWRIDNPDKYAELNRRKERIRRARKLNNGTEVYTEQQLLELHGNICHLCEKTIDLSAPRKVGEPGWENGLHVDHVVAIANGGPDNLDNVRPAHGICNLQKGSD